MRELENMTAIVTGATSGIGREAALAFAKAGARLVLGARRNNQLAEVVKEVEDLGAEAIAVSGDLREEAFAQALAETAQSRFGGLDVAFNNAGMLSAMGPVESLDPADWSEILSVNLTGAFYCAKYQVPLLRQSKSASLIFTSTFVGETVGMPGMSAYAASKAGVNGMMRCLAAELGPEGIRVNALMPGGTDTPMGDSFIDSPETKAFVESIHSLKRMAQPEEIAKAALFLASPASSFVTGTTLFADGGVSINKT